jgi:hypothetical protein
LKIHFPKTNSHFGFLVAIVVFLLLLLLPFQQDETNVKIFLPVATATDKNTRLHCQLPSPFPCFASLCLLVLWFSLKPKKTKNANFPSQ